MASQGRSPELRQDPVSKRWVIFSPTRAKRPTDFKSKSPENPDPNPNSCAFCIGNEHDCAPEIFRVPDDPSNSDWKIRVIQNLYPALSRELQNSATVAQNSDPDGCDHVEWGRVYDGFGFHDPVHWVQLYDLEPREIGDVLLAYKKRIDQIASFESIKYVQAVNLGGLLKLMLRKMSLQLNNPPFNLMIQTSPLKVSASELSYCHWFLQIVPQLTGIGGFELGTGCYINPVFPEDAAKVLREVNIPA